MGFNVRVHHAPTMKHVMVLTIGLISISIATATFVPSSRQNAEHCRCKPFSCFQDYHRRQRRRHLKLQGTSNHTANFSPDTVEYSDFWGNVIRKDQDGGIHHEGNENSPPPCIPTLDPIDGPLPSGCYLNSPRSQASRYHDPKPTCRLSTAVDLSQRYDKTEWDVGEVIRNMQKLIDSGLTTFQLAYDDSKFDALDNVGSWGEEYVYGRLIQETPNQIIQSCHLIVPWSVRFYEENRRKDNKNNPNNAFSSFRRQDVRETVLEKLRRTGGEAIDTLQLKCDNGIFVSPYAMDVLDVLSDLKRDGYLRSITIAADMGQDAQVRRTFDKKQVEMSSFFRSAATFGFEIDAWQVPGSILNPQPPYTPQLTKLSSTLNGGGPAMMTWLSSPLAGGLLTDRHVRKTRYAMPNKLTKMERRHFQTTLSQWDERRRNAGIKESPTSIKAFQSEQHLWERYQQDVLDDCLGYIALKHKVSIASVALRWTIQTTPRGSAVTTCRLSPAEDEEGRNKKMSLRNRRVQFREVFRFELDEEDIHMLNELSCRAQQQQQSNPGHELPFPEFPEWEELDEAYLEAIMEQQEQQGHSDHEIDFNNRKLWL